MKGYFSVSALVAAALLCSVDADASPFHRRTSPAVLASKNAPKVVSSTITKTVDYSKTKEDDPVLSTPRGGAAGDITPNALMGAVALTLVERGTNLAFQKYGVKFPSMLGGCVALFFGLLLLQSLGGNNLGDQIFEFLTPGSNLLGKWLPILFVPGLANLPLAPSIGSAIDVSLSVYYLSLQSPSCYLTTFLSICTACTQSTSNSWWLWSLDSIFPFRR